MRERGIKQDDICAALYNGRHLRGKDGTRVAHRRLDHGVVLRVVYRGPINNRIIQTAYYKTYEAEF